MVNSHCSCCCNVVWCVCVCTFSQLLAGPASPAPCQLFWNTLFHFAVVVAVLLESAAAFFTTRITLERFVVVVVVAFFLLPPELPPPDFCFIFLTSVLGRLFTESGHSCCLCRVQKATSHSNEKLKGASFLSLNDDCFLLYVSPTLTPVSYTHLTLPTTPYV